MPVYFDQLCRAITLHNIPERIISLVPSQTELLYELGLDEQVKGITKFCVHPEKWFRNKTRIGGTKNINISMIHQLNPDLIIANKEENGKEQIEELEKHYPVWISDVTTLQDAAWMIAEVGKMTDKILKANEIIQKINENFYYLQTINTPAIGNELQAAYLIWRKPYMTVGGDTFINTMMQKAGFTNIFSHLTRYPEITIEELRTKNVQLLLLPSEPYPFKQQHADELWTLLSEVKACCSRIILVDGEMFSWYGSRLLKAPAYFFKLYKKIGLL